MHSKTDEHVGDSQYESLFYDEKGDGKFYLLRESIPHEEGSDFYHAVIEKVDIKETKDKQGKLESVKHSILESCPTEDEFEGDSKGFEGMLGLHGADGTLYLVGLCEGNYCAQGRQGKDRGNGVMVVMERVISDKVSSTTS